MRKIDDHIIYALNAKLPTDSFLKEEKNPSVKLKNECASVFTSLMENYSSREKLIKNCISQTSEKLIELKKIKEENENDPMFIKKLRNEQIQVTWLNHSIHVHYILLTIYLVATSSKGTKCGRSYPRTEYKSFQRTLQEILPASKQDLIKFCTILHSSVS